MERTNNEYNSRNRPYFITPQVHIVFHGTESISYLGLRYGILLQKNLKVRNH